MDTALDELRETIALREERALLATEMRYGELNLTVAPEAIVAFVAYLEADSSCRFTTLIDITVYWPAREKRFDAPITSCRCT